MYFRSEKHHSSVRPLHITGAIKRGWFSVRETTAKRHRSRRCDGHMGPERLENRTLLAVSFTPASPPVLIPDGPDIRLGMSNGTTEIAIAVSDADPGNIAVANQGRIRVSSEAGVNFTSSLRYSNPTDLLAPGACGGGPTIPCTYPSSSGDPDVMYDADGNLFYTNLARLPAGSSPRTRTIAVAQVDEINGVQVANTVFIPLDTNLGNPANTSYDKQFMAADNDLLGTSPYRNNLYMAFTELAGTRQVLFSRRDAGTTAWTTPITLSNTNPSDDEGFVWPADVTAAVNGDVYVAYRANPGLATGDYSTGRILVTRSTDGGMSFPNGPTEAFAAGEADITENQQHTSAVVGSPYAIPGVRTYLIGNGPWVLSDPTDPDNVYVVAADDPDDVPGSGDDGDVVFARSDDAGATWTNSTIVSGPANSLQLFPTAAISESGVIVVAWYDSRRGLVATNPDHPDACNDKPGTGSSCEPPAPATPDVIFDVFATYSIDGGLTWVPEFMVSDPDNPLTQVTPGTSVRFLGNDIDGDAVDLDGDGKLDEADNDGDGVADDLDGDETYRNGEYFGVDVFGGTAYVSWNCNTGDADPASSTYGPTGHQACLDTFPIRGALTVSGDGAASGDTIIVRDIPTNPTFLEVLVNGERQYAGVSSALNSIVVNGSTGPDTITISATLDVTTELEVHGGAEDDIINIDTLGGSTVTVNGEDGDDLIDGGNSGEFLNGGNGNDRIYGHGGQDVISGGNNDDRLEGGSGIDTIHGDAGDDYLLGGDFGDFLFGDQGNDIIFGNDGDDIIDGDIGNDVLNGGNDSDVIDGGAGNDEIEGGAGNDVLIGGANDDWVVGGLDSDTLFGDGGDDTLIGGISKQFGLLDHDVSADYLDGGAGDDAIAGDNANLTFGEFEIDVPGGGDDLILGGGGRDLIFGQDGNDQIQGNAGDDAIFALTGFDLVFGGSIICREDDPNPDPPREASIGDPNGPQGDRRREFEHCFDDFRPPVRLKESDPNAPPPPGTPPSADDGADHIDGGTEADLLYGDNWSQTFQEHTLGGAGDDIFGDKGDDIMFGQVGSDNMQGEDGNDIMLGGDAGDDMTGGADNDWMAGQLGPDELTGEDGEDQLDGGPGVDVLVGGEDDDSLEGGDDEDNLFGDDGDDVLSGGAGADGLIGGPGEDELHGDGGNDVLVGGNFGPTPETDDDVLYGGSGNDVLFGDTLVSLSSFDETAGGDDILNGDGGVDLLFGQVGDDTLRGGDDNDELFGGRGVDLMHGNAGDDLLRGEGDDDRMFGDDGDDDMIGDDGDDQMVGGLGSDRMRGAMGDDRMVGGDLITPDPSGDQMAGGEGRDIIRGDSGPLDDSYVISLIGGGDTIFGGDDADTILAMAGDDVVSGGDGNDVIDGGPDNDVLNGNDGNDLIRGGDHDDSLIGDDGDDILVGDGGNDNLAGGDGLDLLIGGRNSDILDGQDEEDVVIGDTTIYDADDKALRAILAEWTSSNNYNHRIQNIMGIPNPKFATRLNGKYFLIPSGVSATVVNDAAADNLFGGSERDWFLADPLDSAIDAMANELVSPVF